MIARVLVERGFRVGLVEAGPPVPLRQRPAEYLAAFGSEHDWGWRSVAQPELARRQLAQPRGRGPGGSTRINAMIWYPPRAADWAMLAPERDRAPAEPSPRWGSTLPQSREGGRKSLAKTAFQSRTTAEPRAWEADDRGQRLWQDSLAAVTRWVQPETPRWLSEASRRFLQTSLPAVDSPHVLRRMTRAGQRLLAADLLLPLQGAIDSGQLVMITGQVDRVDWNGDAAVGIEVVTSGQQTAVHLPASRGVILAAGALASPCILQRSGIGPADHLRSIGIDSRADVPAVGAGLIDHLIMPLVYATPACWRHPSSPSMADLARWQHAATGPLSSNLAESAAVYRIGDDAEFQVHVTPTHYLLHPSDKSPSAMTLGVNLCRPRSRGQVQVTSPQWDAMPVIDPGYLSDPQDWVDLIAAVRHGQQLAADAAWQGVLQQPLLPSGNLSDEQLRRAIGRFAQTLYHPVASCRIGTPSSGVVDCRGRVHAAERLMVIDASVLPDIPSINPNAMVMTLAHRLAMQLE